MTEQAAARRRTGRLASVPFLAGFACAFLGCCLAGWLVGRINLYRDFLRFHIPISPRSQFYPTASQVRALGRERISPDRIAVIVGGNSILHGHNASAMWTKRLQAELGDRFVVLNLSMPAALPAEFGGTAAEILQRDHPRLLFVTGCGSSTFPTIPDGGPTHRYFYWDAWYKGLLLPYPLRDSLLRQAAKQRAAAEPAFAELQRGMRLDAFVRFQDLWTAVAHEHVSTVWTPATAGHFTRSRRLYVDEDIPEQPVEQRYPASAEEASMRIIRDTMRNGKGLLGEAPEGGTWMAKVVNECFPEAARRRTLMLVLRDSPFYLRQLASAEQATYDFVFTGMVRALEADGMPALEIGGGYSDADYLDRCHFSDQGGQRLALDVIPKLRAMAEQLGYSKEGGGE